VGGADRVDCRRPPYQMSGSRQFCRTVAVAILAADLCACAAYRKCGFAGCPGDAKITAEVKSVFNRYPELEPPNLVYVQTLDRVVYLTGQVNTETELELAQSLASHVAGVKRVVNSINTGYQGH
jgi:osmotically-inducible protein OsmY